MAKAEFKLDGIQALQQKLHQMKEAVETRLDMELCQIGEGAITHAKDHKGYKDRTANLKNSISYVLYKDGQPISQTEGKIPKPEEDPNGQSQVSENMNRFANLQGVIAPKGYTLIVVAGMNYGAYVQAKGYNVLYLTERWTHNQIKQIIRDVLNEVKSM